MIFGYGIQIERLSAGYYLLLYAFVFSFPFLFGVFKLVEWSFPYFSFFGLEFGWIFSLAFLVKFPVYFVHLWLPKAHVEAPTYGRVLLAGLLLKLGGVGFVRLLFGLNVSCCFLLVFVGFLGMILAALIASFQRDLKALVAFSRIRHMSTVLVGLVLFSSYSKFGRLLLILAHGFTSSSMFFLVGNSFHFLNRRKVYFLNRGIGSSLFVCALFSFVLVSNFSAPPFISFFREVSLLSVLFFSFSLIWFLIFLYLIYVMYFSLYFLVNFFVGKHIVFFNEWSYGALFLFCLVLFNIFFVICLF